MEKYKQIRRKKGTGWTTRHKVDSIQHERVPETGSEPELLDVNGCIRHLTRLFSPALEKKIRLRTALGNNELPVMGDRAQIARIFAVLVACGSQLTPGGNMTILTTLLPLDIGLVSKRTGNGCALLSFRIAGRGGQRIGSLSGLGRDDLLHALVDVRHIVEKHHGCFKLCVRETEMIFNIYLPVVQRTPLVRAVRNVRTAFRGRKEGL